MVLPAPANCLVGKIKNVVCLFVYFFGDSYEMREKGADANFFTNSSSYIYRVKAMVAIPKGWRQYQSHGSHANSMVTLLKA